MIGCGILFEKQEIFYTKNGAFIGVAFKDVEYPSSGSGLYPAVCIQSVSHQIKSNFGLEKFVFDIEGFKQRESLESFFDICQVEFDRSQLHNLVKSYLVHYAYVETL